MIKDQAYWQQQIVKGLKWRKDTSREEAWTRISDYYEHKFKDPTQPHFNLIYMLASSWIPTLIFQSPGIINSARRPEFITAAQIFDGIDNWLVGEMEVQEVYEQAVINAFLYNTVGIEVGYDFPEDRNLEKQSDLVFGKVEGCVDRSRKYNQPWLDLVPPEKLILAPGTLSMKNCRWYAKSVMVRTESLQKMKGMKNVYPTHVPDEIVKQSGTKAISDLAAEGFTSLWIIHDAETGTWCWLNSEGVFVLEPEEDPLQIDGLPLSVITFNRGARSLWGTSDAIYIESQQTEGDECRQDGRLQRKEALVKAIYDKSIWTQDEVKDFLEGKAMAFIGADLPPDKKLGDVVQLVQPHVQGELFGYQKELLNDAQLVAGTGPNQMGTFAPGRRTKYEVGVVEERNFLRAGLRRQRIASSIQECFERANQLIVREWKAPMIAKVVGIDGVVYWVKTRPSEFKEIAAQLTTSVNVESLAPISRERRKSEMMELLATLSKVQGVNIMPLVQQLVSLFSWGDATKLLPQMQQSSPMSVSDFEGQQQSLMKNPQTAKGTAGNLGRLQDLLGRLPQGNEATNE